MYPPPKDSALLDANSSKILSLKIDLKNPSSSVLNDKPLEDLQLIMEKIASKRRTTSDNLMMDKLTPNKLVSNDLNQKFDEFPQKRQTKTKKKLLKNQKTFGGPENCFPNISSEDKQKVIFTEPGDNSPYGMTDPKQIGKRKGKKSEIHAHAHIFSTGITTNSRQTKQTEEDFESDDISEGKNRVSYSIDAKEEINIDIREDFIEKVNEISEGVKYTFGGVGMLNEESEEDEKKEDNPPIKRDLNEIVKDMEIRKHNYQEIEKFFNVQKTHEKSLSEHNFLLSFADKDICFDKSIDTSKKHQIGTPFVPNFTPKKLDLIDENTRAMFKKHLDTLKNKKRETRSDDLDLRDKNCKVF